MAMKKIIICYDGSDFAKRAVDFVISNIATADTELHLVYVGAIKFGETVTYMNVEEKMLKMVRENGEKVLNEEYKKIVERFKKVTVKYLEGTDIADTILEYGKLIGANLIVAGSRGISIWAGALLGSVSQKLTVKSPVPVLIVK
ncbi:MAG: universal stress protein [Thermoplasmata archaeon]